MWSVGEVRVVRHYPIVDDQGEVTGFGRLRHPLVRAEVAGPDGAYHLTLDVVDGTTTWQHPAVLRHRMIVVGEGKRRQRIPDVLSPKEEVKGEMERFNHLSQWRVRMGNCMDHQTLAAVTRAIIAKAVLAQRG